MEVPGEEPSHVGTDWHGTTGRPKWSTMSWNSFLFRAHSPFYMLWWLNQSVLGHALYVPLCVPLFICSTLIEAVFFSVQWRIFCVPFLGLRNWTNPISLYVLSPLHWLSWSTCGVVKFEVQSVTGPDRLLVSLARWLEDFSLPWTVVSQTNQTSISKGLFGTHATENFSLSNSASSSMWKGSDGPLFSLHDLKQKWCQKSLQRHGI